MRHSRGHSVFNRCVRDEVVSSLRSPYTGRSAIGGFPRFRIDSDGAMQASARHSVPSWTHRRPVACGPIETPLPCARHSSLPATTCACPRGATSDTPPATSPESEEFREIVRPGNRAADEEEHSLERIGGKLQIAARLRVAGAGAPASATRDRLCQSGNDLQLRSTCRPTSVCEA